MVVLSRRRLLYVFVITLIIATLCLWLGWRGNESSLRPKWRNVLSSSSSMSHLAQTRPWAKRLESVRQLMSLNRLEDTQPGKKTSKLDTGNGHHVFGDLWTATGNHMDMKERDYEDGEVLINENKVTSEISKNSNESQAIMTEGTVLSYNNADSVTNGVASEVRNQELESSSLNMLARMGITNQLKNGMESMLPVLPSKDNLIRKVVNFTSSKVKDFIKDIPPPTNLPWNKKQLLVSSKGIYERPWVQNLQHFLQYSYDPAYPVTLVSTNQLFVESVINWLIHSLVVLESPLKNVLVLTMDEGVYDFLKNRNINTVCVPAANNVKIDKPKKMFLMVRVEAARLLVLRMLNHWGIDVINYDNDAIVLKNPQPLLDALGRYDVIGSEGFMPYEVHERWGVTLCFGYFLLRATPATKKLWDVMCSLDVNDDQKKFNFAFSLMELRWHNRTSPSQFWRGQTNHHNLSVAVFPLAKMCRGLECNPGLIDQYYVWHKGGGHKYNVMVKGSQRANLWLVRPEWRQVSGEGKSAKEWLRSVANLEG